MRYFVTIGAYTLAFYLFTACTESKERTQKTYLMKEAQSNGYTYKYVPQDPMQVRIYTLENGLEVYLSKNDAEPRIYTSIAIKAGGKNDPEHDTGLAHYLEHILFKGTKTFGTQDWEKEKPLLDSIEHMFQTYRTLKDPQQRQSLYQQIDKVSSEAAQYAIPNEYDKMLSFLGATGTNAYTSNDRTVYINNIPANQLDNWLFIEADRFQNIIPRLFHTELETVYEEKNRSLDNDPQAMYEKLFGAIFPTHPYGTQTVIGTIEHLKNPSITEINTFFQTYYCPNNTVICLAGDLDYDKTIQLIDKHLGPWKPQPDLPTWEKIQETPLEASVEHAVQGPDAEQLVFAFRFDGHASEQYKMITLIDYLLSNSQAGLIDLNLKQTQKVLDAYSFVTSRNDYSLHVFGGQPREGQTLEEVRDLLLRQIQLLKEGQFDEWLIDAVINDLKKQLISQFQSNQQRANFMVVSATSHMDWTDFVSAIQSFRQYTKQDIVQFANEHYHHHALVYKEVGDRAPEQVEKPVITKMNLNKNVLSPFHQALRQRKTQAIQPKYLDYTKDIQKVQVKNDLDLFYVHNHENDLFSLYYYFDIGRTHDPKLQSAIRYAEYLAPQGMSPEDFKREFYKIGCELSFSTNQDNTYISLQGLSEHTARAVQLLEQLLQDPQRDEDAFEKLIEGILKERKDNMKSKDRIRSALINYALYGPKSPFTNILSNQALRTLSAQELLDLIQKLPTLKHRILYYGPLEQQQITQLIDKEHAIPEQLKSTPAVQDYDIQAIEKPTVYFAHYDMVQAEMLLLTRNQVYDPQIVPQIRLFNEYLSPQIFQEIREAQGLAYATFARYNEAQDHEDHNYFYAYLGTQADKYLEAITLMKAVVLNIPRSEEGFHVAQSAIRNQIESQRILRADILFDYERARKRNLDTDIRKKIYEETQKSTMEDLAQFHQDNLRSNDYHLIVLAHKDYIDIQKLRDHGTIQTLSLEQIFQYEQTPQ